MRIGEITSSAKYRTDEKFQNLPIFRVKSSKITQLSAHIAQILFSEWGNKKDVKNEAYFFSTN